ncbi:methylenetetrahydrofolate reductase [Kangiella sediminilitoris]|uniref:Methylenetetrahydrofolate reductase n=1 Tax=Kangiella sediminilitoris TaxID=1144748 RepID=A0A1B3BB74_9GAMM|nr:methylenetetrahydrofolate reductase [Kangiella sediminilitoris]AOE50051.1 Methylenetetrahydrofolate reductase [Kangiella sediminilitoris]
MASLNNKAPTYEEARIAEFLNEQIADLDGKVNVSFEFFPPKSPEMQKTLWKSIKKLEPLNPEFVSVTYGAAASTRSRTHDVITKIIRETGLTAVPHLTCIGSSESEIEAIAEDYWEKGVRHIVALRGDLGDDSKTGDFQYATDLIHKLKSLHDFEISVAAYPEVHPEAESAESDLQNLKRKVDAGASRAISQFFFSAEKYLRFRDRCDEEGIGIDLNPGILPVTNFPQLLKFAKFTQVDIPEWMFKVYEGLQDDPETSRLIASHIAIEQVKLLVKEGVEDFHFYTLNRADLTYAICHSLGKRCLPSVA